MAESRRVFSRKSLYHSDLRKHGKITLNFKANPLPSQYPDKPPFVPIGLQGDDTDYTYQVENEQIAEAIRAAPKKVWLDVTAVGMEGDAEFVIENSGGGPVPATDGHGSNNGVGRPQRARRSQAMSGYPSYADDLWAAILASRKIHERYLEEFGEPLSEEVRTLGVAIHIQASRESYAKPIHDDVPTPEEFVAGPVPTASELNNLLEQAPISATQRESLRESIADGTMSDERLRTIAMWLEKKISEAENESLPVDPELDFGSA